MNWSSPFIAIPLGVIAGVAANVVTHFVLTVWLPAYRDYVYRGARVDGNWVVHQSRAALDGGNLSSIWLVSAKLDQRAYVITGSASAMRVHEGIALDVINYEVQGYIYDRFVSLNLRNTDKTRIAHSTFLLELRGDGHRMTGCRAFYGLEREIIRSIECVWQRSSPKETGAALTELTVEVKPVAGPSV